MRKQDTISFDQSIKITSGIKEKAGVIDVTIPKNLPQVKEGSLWYLRVQTSLSTAPQVCLNSLVLFARGVISIAAGCRYLRVDASANFMQMPSLFNAQGPFTVAKA